MLRSKEELIKEIDNLLPTGISKTYSEKDTECVFCWMPNSKFRLNKYKFCEKCFKLFKLFADLKKWQWEDYTEDDD
jgi:hypothetical protein